MSAPTSGDAGTSGLRSGPRSRLGLRAALILLLSVLHRYRGSLIVVQGKRAAPIRKSGPFYWLMAEAEHRSIFDPTAVAGNCRTVACWPSFPFPPPKNPSASVHLKRFSTPSLTLKFLCAGKLNPRINIGTRGGSLIELRDLRALCF
jgi:hypothetical protein